MVTIVRPVPANKRDDGVRREHLIECVVANESDQRHTPDEQRSQIAEWGPRLDHLRQAELRSLSRMKSHEKRAEGAAEQNRDRHPDEIASECHADEAGGNGCEVRVASEPYRPQVPQLAVAL